MPQNPYKSPAAPPEKHTKSTSTHPKNQFTKHHLAITLILCPIALLTSIALTASATVIQPNSYTSNGQFEIDHWATWKINWIPHTIQIITLAIFTYSLIKIIISLLKR